MRPMEFDGTVDAYMSVDPVSVRPADSVAAAVETLGRGPSADGLPVCAGDGTVVGFVAAADLLGVPDDAPVRAAMRRGVATVHPETPVRDAAAVMLRRGCTSLPVVDGAGALVGVFSNDDAVRSRIERTTPAKVDRTREMLERTHGVAVGVTGREVPVSSLIPTQRRIHADELAGRRYELRNGLAEPLIVVAYGAETVLVDGHHRAVAARRLGVEAVPASVLSVSPDEVGDLGLRRTARRHGLRSLADVVVTDAPRRR